MISAVIIFQAADLLEEKRALLLMINTINNQNEQTILNIDLPYPLSGKKIGFSLWGRNSLRNELSANFAGRISIIDARLVELGVME